MFWFRRVFRLVSHRRFDLVGDHVARLNDPGEMLDRRCPERTVDVGQMLKDLDRKDEASYVRQKPSVVIAAILSS